MWNGLGCMGHNELYVRAVSVRSGVRVWSLESVTSSEHITVTDC